MIAYMPERAENRYRLVDADTHVNEPPDLWTSRVPARYRDRVPQLQRFEEGDAWVGEGVKDPINFGFNAAATLSRFERKAWVRFDDIPRGGYDPAVRLEEMDADLVDAAVFYPTPRLSHIVISNKDPELHLEMVRAYNDWLIDYCAHDPISPRRHRAAAEPGRRRRGRRAGAGSREDERRRCTARLLPPWRSGHRHRGRPRCGRR